MIDQGVPIAEVAAYPYGRATSPVSIQNKGSGLKIVGRFLKRSIRKDVEHFAKPADG